MERIAFGTTGLLVSRLGLGAGPLGDPALDDAEAERLLHGALDLGVALIDTAPSYGLSEERIGRYLAGRRREFVLATKLGYGVPGVPDWTAPCVAQGIDLALSRLRSERIDVALLHSCPAAVAVREDILRALEDARAAGKIGTCGYSGDNEPLEAAIGCGRFGAIEASVNIVDQHALGHAIPAAGERGLGVIAKRPLANGPWRDLTPPQADDRRLYWQRFRAMDLPGTDLPWAELFARFAAHAPGVHAMIAGTRALAHLHEIAAAVSRGPLPADLLDLFRSRFDDRGPTWAGLV